MCRADGLYFRQLTHILRMGIFCKIEVLLRSKIIEKISITAKRRTLTLHSSLVNYSQVIY